MLPKRLVAYYASWAVYGREYLPADIPADKLTHLNFAFANVDASGRVMLGNPQEEVENRYEGDVDNQPFYGLFNQILNKVRGAHPELKVQLAVGGWTWSGNFSSAAQNETGRAMFVQSATELVEKYGFDGLDIDWEYPVEGGLDGNQHSPEDGNNFVLLLQDLRAKLAPGKLLSIAAPAIQHIAQHMDMAKVSDSVDFVNLMTYDFRGGWSNYTGHASALYPSTTDPDVNQLSVANTVKWYLANGMPAEKINLGLPLYGRGWQDLKKSNARVDGLFKQFDEVPRGTWDERTGEKTGVFDYADVMKKINAGEMQRHWDPEAHAAWAYSESKELVISYDDVEAVQDKAQFVLDNQLGGLMLWELSGDDRTGNASLVDAAYMRFATGKPADTGKKPHASVGQFAGVIIKAPSMPAPASAAPSLNMSSI